jgi:hypothetical protein
LESINWINFAQVRDKCCVVVNKVINFQVPYNVEKYVEELENWYLLTKYSAPLN